MQLNMVMFKVTICDIGKMNINMTDKIEKRNASGVISLGAVGYEVFHDSNVKSSNVIDAAMGAISFVPGWGWIAGGIYFGADIVTKLSTGKSIGEHLDAAIEERYDIDNGVLLEW